MKRLSLIAALLLTASVGFAAKPVEPVLPFPPTLPGGLASATDTSDDFLKGTGTLKPDVTVAKAAPTVDFMYYPGQDYPGRPWSTWGDSIVINGKYYASIGDHIAPAGNARVFEYDPATKTMRKMLDIKELLKLPEGDYCPGKIHSRLELADDGWVYCSTHRGSASATTDKFHYLGDWILRFNPATGKSEVVAQGVVPKHCVPTSIVDPKRMIYYGGTAAGSDAPIQDVQFFAYDLANHKVIYTGPNGPPRSMIFAKSTGRVYFVSSENEAGPLLRYDPEKPGPPVEIAGTAASLRAASQETADGMVYCVNHGSAKNGGARLWSFNTKTEKAADLGPAAVGANEYITTLDVDPTGRFVYYVPGAHGGAETDGSPVVQYDVKTGKKKVIAFLHPFYQQKYNAMLRGTFAVAVDEKGETVYVSWNTSRGSKAWDCVALTAIHIPQSER